MNKNYGDIMKFDQWIDAVNAAVRGQLGNQVKTQELGWDSAYWVSSHGNAAAALNNNEHDVTITFGDGDKLSVAHEQPAGAPEVVAAKIAAHLR